MNADIVIPDNNENEFIDMADRLGYKKIYFLYDFEKKSKAEQKNRSAGRNIAIGIGFLVNQKNINTAHKYSKLLVAQSSENDRSLIEGKKIKIIYGFEGTSKRDYIHQRASGLNHTICSLASKNNVLIGFCCRNLAGDKIKNATLLGRTMQNIKLCQRYKTKTIISSFARDPFMMRAPYDAANLFSVLGMGRKNINDSMDFYF